jgi:hypothetical protein
MRLQRYLVLPEDLDINQVQFKPDENGHWVRSDAATTLEFRIAALEAENERLLSLSQRWSEGCTGRHGSQEQCVTPETSVEQVPCEDCGGTGMLNTIPPQSKIKGNDNG